LAAKVDTTFLHFARHDLFAFNTRSIFDETKFYDHIAWFDGRNGVPRLSMDFIKGGNFDFVGKVLTSRNLSKTQLSFRISDHYPLWAEFAI
jgi:hypothetical protein